MTFNSFQFIKHRFIILLLFVICCLSEVACGIIYCRMKNFIEYIVYTRTNEPIYYDDIKIYMHAMQFILVERRASRDIRVVGGRPERGAGMCISMAHLCYL